MSLQVFNMDDATTWLSGIGGWKVGGASAGIFSVGHKVGLVNTFRQLRELFDILTA